MREPGDRQPTIDALRRGAQFALHEARGRAGRFKVRLADTPPAMTPNRCTAAWIGSSLALMQKGEWDSAAMNVAAFDTHPWESASTLHLTPGCLRQGEAAARWAKRGKAERIYVVQDEDELPSKTIADGFVREAVLAGLNVVQVEGFSETRLVPHILAAKADFVFFSGEEAPYGTTRKLFSALREQGFQGTLAAGDADPGVSFLATRPSIVEGTYLVSPFAPAPPDVAARMGFVPGPHVTAGYFAMKAVLDSLDLANSIDPNVLWRGTPRLPYFDAERRAAQRPCALYVARNGLFEFVEELK
ncbi:MAG: hypothetical protein HY293_07780 [Planctomycetes bacterium]|nr:hypothetical protein [Planctomycetota bacterium]